MFQKLFFSAMVFISAVLLSLNRLYAQEEEGEIIIISEKVGEIIDLEERNKYNLFPGIKGFQSAMIFKLPDDSYVGKVAYLDDTNGEKKINWIPQTESEISRIRSHIDPFKEIVFINEKVGKMIDREERNKYNLFPSIKAFQSAVLYNYRFGSYLWKVTYLDETTGEEKIKWISPTELELTRIGVHKETPLKLKGIFCFNIGLGTSFHENARLGMIISEIKVYEFIAFAASMVVAPKATIISGNVSFNPDFNTNNKKRLIPFWTFGSSIDAAPLLNFGGGVKIRLIKNLGIRTEYRHWWGADINVGSIFGSISLCF